MSGTRYQISFGVFGPLLTVVGLRKSASFVELDDDEVRVRMGWGFRATLPRRSIQSVKPFDGIPGGIGVHGFRGRYLVNGSAKGIVTMALDPIQRASMMGFPVKLAQLSVSLDEPVRFIAEVDGAI